MDKLTSCLKKVSIQNFLTYSKIDIENFDPNINLIIGVNGSGKTSFFKAIEFTLTKSFRFNSFLFDKLCNDKSIKALQVKIILSNNITFTRKLTCFNEQYFVDDELVMEVYYYNILKYFFFDNFYLFPQGQINNLINSNDKFKKELIKLCLNKNYLVEIYDLIECIHNNFSIAEKISSDILLHLEKNQENAYILEKRRELENDMRIVQFLILEKKINSLEEKLLNKKNEYQTISKDLETLTKDSYKNKPFKLDETFSQSSDKSLMEIEEESNSDSINSFDSNFNEFKLELELNEFNDQLKKKKKEKIFLIKNNENLEKTIEEKKKELDAIFPNLDLILTKENNLKKEIFLKKLKIEELYSNSTTKKLTTNEQLNKINDITSTINKIENEILNLKKQEAIFKNESQVLQKNIFENQKEIKEISFDIKKTDNDVLKKQNEKRSLLKKIDELEKNIATQEDKRNNLHIILGKSIFLGKESLDELIDKFKTGSDLEKQMVNNYYGLFIDNIKFDNNFTIAVERTSYSFLHRHIVKDTNTANFFLKHFNLQKMKGICEFVVLDLLKNDETKLEENNQIYKPLISCVAYEKKLEKVVKFCFKKKYICRSIEDVFYLNKNFDFVTLDGDLLFNNKSMSGGYINVKKLWIKNYEKYKLNQSQLEVYTKNLNLLKKDLSKFKVDVEINLAKVNLLEQSKIKKKSSSFDFSTSLKKNEQELENINNVLKKLQDSLFIKKEELEFEKEKLSYLNDQIDLGTSIEKHKLIAYTQKEIKDLTKNLDSINKDVTQLKLKKQFLELELQENLYKQQGDLKNKIKATDLDLSNLERNIENLLSELNSSKKITKEENKTLELKTKTTKYNFEEDSLLFEDSQNKSFDQSNDQVSFKITQLRLKMNNNIEMQKNYEKKISSMKDQIMDVPKQNKFKAFNLKKLFKKLEDCQKQLAIYQDENKSEFINSMIEKKYEIYNNELIQLKEIYDFIYSLFKKNLNWSKLFKNLSIFMIQFRDFFKNFVENGEIFIKITLPNNFLAEKNLFKNMNWAQLSPVLHVSFDGQFPKKIDTLSGGQKTIISLCFLLAKISIEPLPFLLFDETDQNLDEITCLKLGEILKNKFKNKNQFFFSSNRTYFANFSDKIFKVMVNQKGSEMNEVELDYWSSQESKPIEIPSLSSSNESQLIFTQLEENTLFEDNEEINF